MLAKAKKVYPYYPTMLSTEFNVSVTGIMLERTYENNPCHANIQTPGDVV